MILQLSEVEAKQLLKCKTWTSSLLNEVRKSPRLWAPLRILTPTAPLVFENFLLRSICCRITGIRRQESSQVSPGRLPVWYDRPTIIIIFRAPFAKFCKQLDRKIRVNFNAKCVILIIFKTYSDNISSSVCVISEQKQNRLCRNLVYIFWSYCSGERQILIRFTSVFHSAFVGAYRIHDNNYSFI